MTKLFVGLSMVAGLWAVIETRAALRQASCVMVASASIGEHPEDAAKRLASCD